MRLESTVVKMPHCWKSHVTAQMSFIICTFACSLVFSIGRLPVMRDGDVTETKVANIFTLLRKQVLHICNTYNMGLVARKPVFRVSAKASFIPVFSATETS